LQFKKKGKMKKPKTFFFPKTFLSRENRKKGRVLTTQKKRAKMKNHGIIINPRRKMYE